eukprot:SAG31_NODE_7177_length_1765_cov_1.361945_1_plen_298_part_00
MSHPSPLTGTGSALLTNGADARLVRASLLDSAGEIVHSVANPITFAVKSGSGKLVGTHNGNVDSHEASAQPTVSAYHGLARTVVMKTSVAALPTVARELLAVIDVDSTVSGLESGDEPGATLPGIGGRCFAGGGGRSMLHCCQSERLGNLSRSSTSDAAKPHMNSRHPLNQARLARTRLSDPLGCHSGGCRPFLSVCCVGMAEEAIGQPQPLGKHRGTRPSDRMQRLWPHTLAPGGVHSVLIEPGCNLRVVGPASCIDLISTLTRCIGLMPRVTTSFTYSHSHAVCELVESCLQVVW